MGIPVLVVMGIVDRKTEPRVPARAYGLVAVSAAAVAAVMVVLGFAPANGFVTGAPLPFR